MRNLETSATTAAGLQVAPGRVSVVIATYNMSRFLAESVDSALNQTYRNLEVCVVDDGSTDDTEQVLAKWKDDPRVIVVRQANQGQATAKNRGVKETRGEFIAFLDADDRWLPTKLAKQIPLFEAPRTAVVYTEIGCMDENGNPLVHGKTRRYRGRVTEPLLLENFVPYVTTVVRRGAFEEVRGFDQAIDMGIDWDLWLRISVRHEFDFVDEELTQYRVWSGQMSKKYRRRLDSSMAIMDAFLKKHPGAVSPGHAKRAWAITYTNRGDVLLVNERKRLPAIREMLKALRYKPLFWPAYRSMARALIRTRPFKNSI